MHMNPSHVASFGSSLLAGATAIYAALALHEAGHLIAGACVGFRLVLLGVGPLGLARSGDRVGVRWLPPSLWGPFAACSPVTSGRLPTRFAWFTAGGPLASVCGALVAWPLSRVLHGAAAHWFGLVALASGGLFLATVQPWGSGSGLPSDGGRLLRLMRNDADARAAAALVALETLDATGMRPREWDGGLVQEATQVQRPTAYVLEATTLMLRRAMDGGDATTARGQAARIRELLPRVPRWLRSDAAAEAAFWYAHVADEATAATELLRDAHGGLVAEHRVRRAEAAVRLCEGDLAGTREAVRRARSRLDGGIARASSFDREMLAAVEEKLAALEAGASNA
jgi:hypothetical protein